MMRLFTCSILALLAGAAPLAAQEAPEQGSIRIATFNASLNRGAEGQLVADLGDPEATQPARVAEIIQRVNPDVILINEFDYVEDGEAVSLFVENFLSQGQNGAEAWVPVATFAAPVNTGVASGLDLNADGEVGGADDAFGFGMFPGQYGMVILSKFPIIEDEARTFQNFLWRDMPEARLPVDPETGESFYSDEILEVFRLSSKSHWDVPVDIEEQTIHLLASHPTPPVFDGPEDRNGTRNADEVRFWIDYVNGEGYMTDDAGAEGGLAADASFVIVGDLNLDQNDGDGIREVGAQLLATERVQDPEPRSEGGPEDSEADGGANLDHTGDPALDTADFFDGEGGSGNMRADYVLPSSDLTVTGAGIFWPTTDDDLAALLGEGDAQTSDHRLVWVDIALQ
ncbi:endonuclease/exonuclease/phosphatase family protein [Pelagibacterium sp. 26DY04]|uniref:endonuclease/exonuclease/phosphatase family protein n=1 Tax=Pelagibacterium sp. 26DY04 TaxID=2967130 RepID=UPI0028151D60|nr:endonuclease/exonuclease/phosphatase family protein [Pelagibacterium sp. 26DY04]WMT86669.1 endonuclease/exonuclease/phosphatase family protein [Pelagibacterium sp. 26DY04]